MSGRRRASHESVARSLDYSEDEEDQTSESYESDEELGPAQEDEESDRPRFEKSKSRPPLRLPMDRRRTSNAPRRVHMQVPHLTTTTATPPTGQGVFGAAFPSQMPDASPNPLAAPPPRQPALFAYPHAPFELTREPLLGRSRGASMPGTDEFTNQTYPPDYYSTSGLPSFYHRNPYHTGGVLNHQYPGLSPTMYFVPPQPPGDENEASASSSSAMDPEKLKLQAELKAFQSREEKRQTIEKQQAMEAQIRREAEETFQRRIDEIRRAQEEAHREIAQAEAEAQKAARERLKAIQTAEREKQRQHEATMKEVEERARKRLEAEKKAAEEIERQEEEKRQRNEDEARVKLESAMKADGNAKMALEKQEAFEAEWRKTVEENIRMKAKLEVMAAAEARAEKEKEHERLEKLARSVMVEQVEELAYLSKRILLEFKSEMKSVTDSFNATIKYLQDSSDQSEPVGLLDQTKEGVDTKNANFLYASSVSTPIVDLSALDDRFASYSVPVPTPPKPGQDRPMNNYYHEKRADEATEALARRVADLLIARFEEKKYIEPSTRGSTPSSYSRGQSSRTSYRPNFDGAQDESLVHQDLSSNTSFTTEEGILAPRPVSASIHGSTGGPLQRCNYAHNLEVSASQAGPSSILTPNTDAEATKHTRAESHIATQPGFDISIYQIKDTEGPDGNTPANEEGSGGGLEITTRMELDQSEPGRTASNSYRIDMKASRVLDIPQTILHRDVGLTTSIPSDSGVGFNNDERPCTQSTDQNKDDDNRSESSVDQEEEETTATTTNAGASSWWFEGWLPFRNSSGGGRNGERHDQNAETID